MNAIQDRLLEQAIEGISRTLARAEDLPTLTERAAIYEARLLKAQTNLNAIQMIEQAHRARQQANAGAAA